MRVKDLIEQLQEANPNEVVVIQKNSGPKYYSHHTLQIQMSGHPGHNGPVIHLGEQVTESAAKSPEWKELTNEQISAYAKRGQP